MLYQIKLSIDTPSASQDRQIYAEVELPNLAHLDAFTVMQLVKAKIKELDQSFKPKNRRN